jgi:hypothetical protein
MDSDNTEQIPNIKEGDSNGPTVATVAFAVSVPASVASGSVARVAVRSLAMGVVNREA